MAQGSAGLGRRRGGRFDPLRGRRNAYRLSVRHRPLSVVEVPRPLTLISSPAPSAGASATVASSTEWASMRGRYNRRRPEPVKHRPRGIPGACPAGADGKVPPVESQLGHANAGALDPFGCRRPSRGWRLSFDFEKARAFHLERRSPASLGILAVEAVCLEGRNDGRLRREGRKRMAESDDTPIERPVWRLSALLFGHGDRFSVLPSPRWRAQSAKHRTLLRPTR